MFALVQQRLNSAKAALTGRKACTGIALAGGSILMWAFRQQLLDLAHWGVGLAMGEDVPLLGGRESTHDRALGFIEDAAEELAQTNPALSDGLLDYADQIEDGTVWPEKAPDGYVLEQTLKAVQGAPETAARVRGELVNLQASGAAEASTSRMSGILAALPPWRTLLVGGTLLAVGLGGLFFSPGTEKKKP